MVDCKKGLPHQPASRGGGFPAVSGSDAGSKLSVIVWTITVDAAVYRSERLRMLRDQGEYAITSRARQDAGEKQDTGKHQDAGEEPGARLTEGGTGWFSLFMKLV